MGELRKNEDFFALVLAFLKQLFDKDHFSAGTEELFHLLFEVFTVFEQIEFELLNEEGMITAFSELYF